MQTYLAACICLSLKSYCTIMQVRLQHISITLGSNHWSTLGKEIDQCGPVTAPLRLFAAFRRPLSKMRKGRLLSASNNNRIVASTSNTDIEISEQPLPEKPSATAKPVEPSKSAAGKIQPDTNDAEATSTRIQEIAKGTMPASEAKQNTASSSIGSMPKRSPLTAKEKLRAARVLSKYTESKPSKSNLGSKVLEAMKESDGGKARSGLPEAPTNLFDDSKRGLPKQGWTFNFPGGTDLFIIIFSFVFISTVMFATTYIVWKAGAIHFNEY